MKDSQTEALSAIMTVISLVEAEELDKRAAAKAIAETKPSELATATGNLMIAFDIAAELGAYPTETVEDRDELWDQMATLFKEAHATSCR